MSKEHSANVAALAENATIYIQYDKDEDLEGMRIIACMSEEDYFLAEGEETGESYQIHYSEVDLETDMFYRFVVMDNKSPLLYNQGY